MSIKKQREILKDWLNAMEDSVAQNEITKERLFTVMKHRINVLSNEVESANFEIKRLKGANK